MNFSLMKHTQQLNKESKLDKPTKSTPAAAFSYPDQIRPLFIP